MCYDTFMKTRIAMLTLLLLILGCQQESPAPEVETNATEASPAPETPTVTAAELFEEAQCRYLSDAHAPALEHVNQALELEPDHPEALLLKARILTSLDRKDDAFATLDALRASKHTDATKFIAKIPTDDGLQPLAHDPRWDVNP